MKYYYNFLKGNPTIRVLSLVNLIASFGAWFSTVAIYTMVVDFGSNELVIALVTAMHFIPAIIIAPFSGSLIDRTKIKTLMVSVLFIELLMTACFLLISSSSDMWLLLILIFIRMSAASIFFSSEMSLLAKLLSGKDLQTANEIQSIIWSFSYAVGMATSGIIVNIYDPKTAIMIDVVIFIVAFIIFSRIQINIEYKKVEEKIFELMIDGLRYIKNNKIIIHLIILHASVGLTSYDALITILAKNEYKELIAVPLAIGLSNAVRALALMIGPIFLNKIIKKSNLHYLLFFQGLTIIFWAFTQFNFYLSLVALFFVGFSTAFLWSYTYSLLQERCDNKYIGRVISYNDMVFMMANVLTTFFIGSMAHITTTTIITICLGIAFIFYAIYYIRIYKDI
ncbi:enterobactin exporter EntS [Aliarcobacter thereius]|uniref:MFS transporter n=2 Tax=Aliarcobacter thereius TaxID=544718 RepID=A0A5R9H0W8_9BACT|nr:MFS transporter [Aliarcobacter thereius]OCL88752.1 enterobactin exporter EntS [Aliarcobacter thereius]OCL92247.1 enterobactin exporter EntS [Aliarcobacter thereius]OCL94657.1 enterobactin exporter EntS [Aliarcobacter thereius LMG 24486]QBF15467.1 proton antiporter protein, major facilitator superfamily [Aliarcobacter thereius LMG 24486]TLS72315.1 MFS transporter [Aliarcobacter thereius]